MVIDVAVRSNLEIGPHGRRAFRQVDVRMYLLTSIEKAFGVFALFYHCWQSKRTILASGCLMV